MKNVWRRLCFGVSLGILAASGAVWPIGVAHSEAGASDLTAQVEAALLTRFQETDRPRTDYAVLLATRYRHARGAMAAGKDVRAELTEILERCQDKARSEPMAFEPVDWAAVPALVDGGDLSLLARALAPAAARSGGGSVSFGTQKVSAGDLARGARRLAELVRANPDAATLDTAVRREFDIYRSPGAFGTGEVLYTSYASPVYEGSLKRTAKYRFPLYKNPSKAGLGTKHTRAEIYAGALEGHDLEIAWLADRMDEFQVQIEGSGFVKLAEGGYLHVTFNAGNGSSYQSLGKAMLRDRLFKPWEIDNLAVRRYFRQHPADQQRYLEMNPSWVYFNTQRIDELPQRPEYIRERSVAADRSVFARGQIGFADTFAPEYSDEGLLTGRSPWRRFILAQDVGGAIKGAGRIDLYQGQGGESQHLADTMKEPGALYLLLLKGVRPR